MKTKLTILCGLFAVILALTFAACRHDNDNGGPPPTGGGGTPPTTITEGATLTQKLEWLLTKTIYGDYNAESGIAYLIEVNANESMSAKTLSFTDLSDITIIIRGLTSVRTISLSGGGPLFTVGNGVTLVLDERITLQGGNVKVDTDGALEMKAGSKISGNSGSGVNVNGGTFTMNGGEISGNTSTSSGGGVYLGSGTFTMNSGKISGNNATATATSNNFSSNSSASISGGGVYVNSGTFTMNGGEISGNNATVAASTSYGGNTGFTPTATANSFGGGAYVNDSGTFTMNGGEISGNTVSASASANYTQQSEYDYGSATATANSFGGGAYVNNGGIFVMKGGKISGNTSTATTNATAVSNGTGGGVATNNKSSRGGGMYVNSGGNFRIVTGTVYGSNEGTSSNTAANEGMALYRTGTVERGTFSGETWTSTAVLDATNAYNDTINVLNGQMQ